jgi:holo-[acyl-carrier protein] synthase
MNLNGGNVIGVGVDLTEIQRIRAAHQKHGQTFLDKIFTPDEQSFCLTKADPYPSLAARFAAKEAVSKALGTGFSEKFSLTSCSIKVGTEGEPIVVLDEKAQALVHEKGATHILVSLTHTDQLAEAFAVLVK